MKEDKYSINEILNAVDELSKIRNKDQVKVKKSRIVPFQKSDIPSSTLKLIEEAEKSIRSK